MKKFVSIVLILLLCTTFIRPQTAEAAVKISKAKATMEVDSTLKLKVSGTKSKVKWKTSKKAVATVNSSGTVTAKSEGQATITATVGGKKYTCAVRVVDSNKPVAKKTYKLGETWTVDGLWTLTFNSVTTTKERNQYSDHKPGQVVILDYTYENLGYETEYLDLFISHLNFKVVDGNGNVASSYPISTQNYPLETPVGAKCVGAQEPFGLVEESDKIIVYVEIFDQDYNEYKATFELDVK